MVPESSAGLRLPPDQESADRYRDRERQEYQSIANQVRGANFCAPGPKHPQLMVSPRRYAEYIAMMNAPISAVDTNPDRRNPYPLSSHSPSNNSNGGRKCANGLTAHGGSIS